MNASSVRGDIVKILLALFKQVCEVSQERQSVSRMSILDSFKTGKLTSASRSGIVW